MKRDSMPAFVADIVFHSLFFFILIFNDIYYAYHLISLYFLLANL